MFHLPSTHTDLSDLAVYSARHSSQPSIGAGVLFLRVRHAEDDRARTNSTD